ncbi:unnamed protein product, partial [Ectocarpus fasciculatus]
TPHSSAPPWHASTSTLVHRQTYLARRLEDPTCLCPLASRAPRGGSSPDPGLSVSAPLLSHCETGSLSPQWRVLLCTSAREHARHATSSLRT